MKFIQDLRPLRLYSKKRKIFIPFDPKNKRKGAAIMLLSPNLDVSTKMMQLQYFYNPNYFQGYYADRSVNAYIDSGGFINATNLDNTSAVEESAINESILFKSCNASVKGDYFGTESYLANTQNRMNKEFAPYFKITKLKYTIFVYGSFKEFEKGVKENCNTIPAVMSNGNSLKLTSFCTSEAMFVLNYKAWSKTSFESDLNAYQLYLDTEALCLCMKTINPMVDIIYSSAIATVLSGAYDYYSSKDKLESNFKNTCKAIKGIIDEDFLKARKKNRDMVISNNFAYVKKYSMINSKNKIYAKAGEIIFRNESALSAKTRKNLPDSDYGLPKQKKYPMPDISHVKAAIRMFNHVSEENEKELAKNINRKIKEFGITNISVGKNNRFNKYFKPILESSNKLPGNYNDVLKIAKSLSPEEFNCISFSPVYENSPNVVHRHIERIGGKPVGFLDVYMFDSQPGVAYMTIAVSPYYRRQGIADKMVKTVLSNNVAKEYNINTWTWNAKTDNIASQKTAEKNGFSRDADLDSHGRYQYRIYLNPKLKIPLPSNYVVINKESFYTDHNDKDFTICNKYASIQTEELSMISFFDNPNSTTLNETEKQYDSKLKRYLYQERIRNNKQVLTIYSRVKETVPFIKRTYITLDKYREFNIFYDLHYYNALFLKNNIFKLDRGINMYLDFITRLINNSELSSIYKYQTIFIPVNPEDWGIPRGEDMTDYKKYINPISMMIRLLRKNPDGLKKALGGKNIIFVANEGYFFVDFNVFSMKHLNKFKKALSKLSSGQTIVEGEDDEPGDEIDNSSENSNSAAALTATVVDKIETNLKIDLPDISAAIPEKTNSDKYEKLDIENLRVRHIESGLPYAATGAAVVLMTPSFSSSANNSISNPFKNSSLVTAYLVSK